MFLFAPFTLMMPASPTPYYLGPGVGVAALLLAERARAGSAAALAALAAVVGISPTIPLALPAAGVAALRVAVAFVRGARADASVVIASASVFAAAALIAVPSFDTAERMVGAYAAPHGEWVGLESALFGQSSALDVVRAWEQPLRGAVAVAAAGLIAPFAVARTPMRGWGDALFDPIGTAVMATGLALALRRARRCAHARWTLLLFAATLAPGLVSSFDRPSVTRMGTLLVAGPLLAALAATTGVSQASSRRQVIMLASLCLSMAATGAILFFAINPLLLRQSSLAISLEAVERRPDGIVALLDYPSSLDVSWLHVRRIGAALGRPPVAAIPLDALARATAAIDRAPQATHVLLWSPGLQGDHDVARSLCQRWPESAVFRLDDATGLSHAWALRIGVGDWQPALPASRWREHRCGEPLTTS
jgi:hypothetical protein